MEEDIQIICLFRNYENIFIINNLNNKKIELNKMNNIYKNKSIFINYELSIINYFIFFLI